MSTIFLSLSVGAHASAHDSEESSASSEQYVAAVHPVTEPRDSDATDRNQKVINLTAVLDGQADRQPVLTGNRWVEYKRQHHHLNAVEDLSAALAMQENGHPVLVGITRAKLLWERGVVYCRTQRSVEAIADLTDALEIQADGQPVLSKRRLAHLLTHRGMAYENEKDDLSAYRDFVQAIEMLSGLEKKRRGERSLIKRLINKIAKLSPRSAERSGKGKTDHPGIATCTSDIDMPTNGFIDHVSIIRTLELCVSSGDYFLNADYQKAITDLTAALNIQVDGKHTLTGNARASELCYRGEAHYQLGNYPQAIVDSTTIIGMAADSSDSLDIETLVVALAIRAASHKEQGNYPQAIVDCTQALDMQVNGRQVATDILRAKILNERASAYAKQNNLELALLDLAAIEELGIEFPNDS